MPSRFTQYGGALGADQALTQMVAERIQAEMEQRKQAMEAYKLQQEDARIGQGDRRMDIDTEQFGQTHGLNVTKQAEDVRQFDAQAPERDARAGYLRTQTKDLEQKPMYADAERAHDEKMAETQGRIRMGQINRQGEIDANQRGEGLADFEAKEQIKAKYGGSRPSLGAERQTLSYFNRAKQASEDIGNMEDGIAQMGLAGQARLQMAPNIMQSESNQRYRQAQRAFTEARLRKESGAAIPQGEYENDAKTYFAQPGDGPEVIAQKRQARQVVLDGLKFASGKAFDEFYGQSNQAPASSAPQGGVTIKGIRQVR